MNTTTGAFLPPGREVACDCDAALNVPVGVDPTGSNERIAACLRCGAVSYTLAGVDEPRAGDIRCYGHRVLALSRSARAWLETWPRLLVYDWKDFDAVSSTDRCATPSRLAEWRVQVRVAQARQTRAARLRAAGLPTDPPPEDLPAALQHYESSWRGSQLSPDAPLEQLLKWADPYLIFDYFGLDALLRRPDIGSLLSSLIDSTEPKERAIGWALVDEDPVHRPAMLPRLLDWLNQVPLVALSYDPQSLAAGRDVEAALKRLLKWRNDPQAVLPLLRSARDRIGRHDDALVRRFDEVVRELEREPPPGT